MISNTQLLAIDAASRVTALELRSFIVDAPAGAGKTELLTQRYLELLKWVESPEEIIAITFTNKAASEMRVRILDSLKMANDGRLPEQPHKKITFDLATAALNRSAEKNWQLLDNPSRLRITTIDALCGNIARQMPLMSRFGSQPSITDNATHYYLQAAANTIAMLDDQNAAANLVASALAYLDNNTDSLKKLLVSMLEKRDQWLPYTQQSLTIDDQLLSNLLAEDLAQISALIHPNLQRELMPIVRYAASQLAEDHPLQKLAFWQDHLDTRLTHIEDWRVLRGFLMTKGGTWLKKIGAVNGFNDNNDSKAHKAKLKELLDLLSANPNAENILNRLTVIPTLPLNTDNSALVYTLSQLLNLAVAHLWQVFQLENTVDFIGVSQRALLALEDASGVTDLGLKLDYKISHLLVDEFQDTSPTQISLLKALTRGWQNNDGRTLFCVGDPMQSIYRFRKADVGLFLQAAEQGVNDIQLTPLKLYQNNRSSPEVVSWINQSFQQLFPPVNSVKQGAIAYSPFVAKKPEDASAGVTIHTVLYANDEDENLLEAKRVIEIIRHTQSTQPHAKIAVLVRAKKHLAGLVREIRRAHTDLRFQALEIERLSDRQSVQDIVALTKAMLHLADRVNWLAILRAPWCGLTLADLHWLCADNHHATVWSLLFHTSNIAKMSPDGQARLAHFKTIMAVALDNKARQTHKRWIESVWLQLNGSACLWEASDMQDIQAYLALIEKLEKTQQFDINTLDDEVNSLFAAPDTLAPDTLQMMSIHKSKGLEFDTVILLGLDRKSANTDKPLLLWEEVEAPNTHQAAQLVAAPLTPTHQKIVDVTDLYDYLHDLEKVHSEHEKMRLLYVAATRTERHLHIVGACKVKEKDGGLLLAKPASNTALGSLWPVAEHAFELALSQYQAPENIDSTANLNTFSPKLLRLKTLVEVIPLTKTTREQTGYWADDNQNENEIEIENSPVQNAEIQTLAKDIGTLTHLYVELINQQGLADWPESRVYSLQAAMQQWFKQRGFNELEISMATKKVVSALITTLNSADGQWLLSQQANTELALQNADTKYVLDFTFIETLENNQKIRWIVDYKSASVESETTDLNAHAKQYKPQLDNYAALFEQEGLPIKKAIFYLSLGKLIVL